MHWQQRNHLGKDKSDSPKASSTVTVSFNWLCTTGMTLMTLPPRQNLQADFPAGSVLPCEKLCFFFVAQLALSHINPVRIARWTRVYILEKIRIPCATHYIMNGAGTANTTATGFF